MPQIYVNQTIRESLQEGDIKNLPRGTINRISRELGHEDWYMTSVPKAVRRERERKKSRSKR